MIDAGGITALHDDEVPIDQGLVRRLLAAQLPGFAPFAVEPVTLQGTDNVIFRLGDELSVRLPRKRAAVHGLNVELEWLPRLARALPVAVPVPVAAGEPDDGYPFPWAVCRWVPGTLLGDRVLGAAGARALGEFVAALQSLDAASGPRVEPGQRAGTLAAYDPRPALSAVVALQAAGRIEPDLVDERTAEQVWAAAVAAPAWAGPGVWVHRDLQGGNLLTSNGTLAGVLDFGGLAVGDPAGDAMGAFHALAPADHAVFREIAGVDDDTWARARGIALAQGLEALPYYLDTHPGMVAMARRVILAALRPA